VPLSSQERTLRASIGALSRWSKEDPKPALEHVRSAFYRRFEDQVDPEGKLDPAERSVRARRALRAHMAKLALKSAKARAK
jgi:hypothetical protein